MAVRGIFSSHSSLVGDRRVNDFAGRILMNGFGGTAPMLALSSGMPKEPIKNTEFSWVEDDHISGNTTATTGYASNATTIVVADSNIWVPNSVILHEDSGEQMYVTGVTGNSITVVRGFAGTVPSAILEDDRLQLIATAFAEATVGAEAVTQVGESRTNYVQIFKQAWAVSNTAKAIEFQTGSKAAKNRADATMYMTESLERAFMFGRPSVSHVNGKQLRTSGGIQHAIETFGGHVVSANANSVAGRINLDVITSFMRTIFDRNIKGFPNERICFTGSAVLEIIQKLVLDVGEYTIKAEESMFGMEVVTLKTFSGTLKLMTHPMWVENDHWNRELWALHPAGIKRKILRDMEVIPFTGANQVDALDAETGHMRTELGFEVKGVKTMGMITNIQSAGGLAALPTT